jgi:hypothetical protein
MRQSKEQIQDKDAIDLGPPPNGDYGCDLGTEDCITKIVDQYPLVLFSLSWRPKCHRMSELLATVGIHQPHIIDLDDYKKDGTNLKSDSRLSKMQKAIKFRSCLGEVTLSDGITASCNWISRVSWFPNCKQQVSYKSI